MCNCLDRQRYAVMQAQPARCALEQRGGVSVARQHLEAVVTYLFGVPCCHVRLHLLEHRPRCRVDDWYRQNEMLVPTKYEHTYCTEAYSTYRPTWSQHICLPASLFGSHHKDGSPLSSAECTRSFLWNSVPAKRALRTHIRPSQMSTDMLFLWN